MIGRKPVDDLEGHIRSRCTRDHNTGCLLWNGAVSSNGYGQITHRRVRRPVHRAMYELVNGKIADGMVVCHRCDTPRCVEPSHLFLGTQADNNRDMRDKGRDRYATGNGHGSKTHPESVCCGEKNPAHALRVDDVLEIRRRHKNGELQRSLAAEFRVDPSQISHIVTGKNWANV